jgi:hypothetical protein
MGATQGISLYSYLLLILAKMACFSYYLSCFFFKKIREQEGETGSEWRRGRGEVTQIRYIHQINVKMMKLH